MKFTGNQPTNHIPTAILCILIVILSGCEVQRLEAETELTHVRILHTQAETDRVIAEGEAEIERLRAAQEAQEHEDYIAIIELLLEELKAGRLSAQEANTALLDVIGKREGVQPGAIISLVVLLGMAGVWVFKKDREHKERMAILLQNVNRQQLDGGYYIGIVEEESVGKKILYRRIR